MCQHSQSATLLLHRSDVQNSNIQGENKMRTKRIYILFLVIGLLAALTTTVYATTNRHPAAPSIVGVWNTTIKVENTDIGADGLWTFSADGNFLDINSTKETNPGVWIGAGNSYVVTFWAFNYD